jgi:hypothetical protein
MKIAKGFGTVLFGVGVPLLDRFRHRSLFAPFLLLFYQVICSSKRKNTLLDTKRAKRFKESPINDNNSSISLIINS